MPVVVLDRCPGRVVSVWQQRQVRTVHTVQLSALSGSGQLRGSFGGPAHRCRAEVVMSTGT